MCGLPGRCLFYTLRCERKQNRIAAEIYWGKTQKKNVIHRKSLETGKKHTPRVTHVVHDHIIPLGRIDEVYHYLRSLQDLTTRWNNYSVVRFIVEGVLPGRRIRIGTSLRESGFPLSLHSRFHGIVALPAFPILHFHLSSVRRQRFLRLLSLGFCSLKILDNEWEIFSEWEIFDCKLLYEDLCSYVGCSFWQSHAEASRISSRYTWHSFGFSFSYDGRLIFRLGHCRRWSLRFRELELSSVEAENNLSEYIENVIDRSATTSMSSRIAEEIFFPTAVEKNISYMGRRVFLSHLTSSANS